MIKIKTNSRKVKPGDTFVALRGINSDGHSYIESAIAAGAIKIVAEEGNYSVETVIVDDTRVYLENLLYDTYKDILNEMNIIGITGTNGKTTSCYLIYEALNLIGSKCAYIGTIGFYMDKKVCDLPNTSPDICDIYDMIVEAYYNGCKNIVMEASSQGLSYGRLNKIPFDIAIFTNLTQDHLDYHKTMEKYAMAKVQLFKQLKTGGHRVINIDDDYCNYYKIDNYLTYGFQNSDYQIKDLKLTSNGSYFTLNDYKISSRLIGKYNIYNMACAVITLDLLKYNKEDIEYVISRILPPPGRMDIINYNSNMIVIDYAHTPDAMMNIINTVKEIKHHNIYTVFGCTGSRDRVKRPIMMQMALDNSNYVFVTSDDLHEEEFEDIVTDMLEGNTQDHYLVEKDRGKAIAAAISKLERNDILLILGKGHENAIIVGQNRIAFNDREEVLKIINNQVKVSN